MVLLCWKAKREGRIEIVEARRDPVDPRFFAGYFHKSDNSVCFHEIHDQILRED